MQGLCHHHPLELPHLPGRRNINALPTGQQQTKLLQTKSLLVTPILNMPVCKLFRTSNIKQSVQGHHCRTCDGHLDRLSELPGIGVGAVALHRVQTRASFPTSHSIHKAVQHHQACKERGESRMITFYINILDTMSNSPFPLQETNPAFVSNVLCPL